MREIKVSLFKYSHRPDACGTVLTSGDTMIYMASYSPLTIQPYRHNILYHASYTVVNIYEKLSRGSANRSI